MNRKAKLPPEHNPALHRFGVELSRMRNLAEMSQRRLARATDFSPQQVGAIERAERYPTREFAQLADDLLDGNGKLVEMWTHLFGEAYPEYLGSLVEAEQLATMIREYHPLLIPGMLQTENYARTTLRAGNPLADESKIDQLIATRLHRQRLLDRDRAPAMWFVLDEIVLQRPMGTPEVMNEQIGHLLELIDQRKIRLQVVPIATTRHHPGLTGPFKVLSFAGQPDLIYVETVARGEMVTDPERVHAVTLLFTTLQGVALSPEQSLQLLYTIRKDLDGTQLA
ncbi:helix-turn-helix transcriptional regulator [Lipingzhangella sp. LS1_29]|uniref:Helix-turn-helix transcriptional regulator n=1 Tax=Lipingzhangella rawalii TaxID=2055835 RepID=A0ABU2HBL9_9ACTN|nr:helix-turn-helix transcriptional regulator [Lipingzhangella rawalii]MDS1272673.1 helix-turn-helix transcriptional regulator [Lipingzhangella rawalii]